ncbi:MAG: class I SAM-dependent methyltransferase [Terriglobales bacterium]
MSADHPAPPEVPAPDSTAVRVALWRALHLELDAPPPVFTDHIGLQLAAPDSDWRRRPDMDPAGTRRFRAAIVARARYIEDCVRERAGQGLSQYVLLGAGLDTFAQRNPDMGGRLRVFELDRPGPQAWKRQRLTELGYGVPDWLRLVAADFDQDSWWQRLLAAGFDAQLPAFVAATGVSMYLRPPAIGALLREARRLAPGSALAMTFLLPLEMADPEDQAAYQAARRGARVSGTPFLSFFTPDDMLALAQAAGFRNVEYVSAADLAARYFAARADDFRPSTGEAILLAGV